MEKLYRITDTGLKAWTSKDSGLPAPYRQILGLTRNMALVGDICDGMRTYPRKDVLRWLDELDLRLSHPQEGDPHAIRRDGTSGRVGRSGRSDHGRPRR